MPSIHRVLQGVIGKDRKKYERVNDTHARGGEKKWRKEQVSKCNAVYITKENTNKKPTHKAKYLDKIRKQLGNTLDTTSLGIGYRKAGKVRDTYKVTLDGKEVVVLVTTDRVSAFDRVISVIPYKGNLYNCLQCLIPCFTKIQDKY